MAKVKGVIMTLGVMFFALVILLFGFLALKNGLIMKNVVITTGDIDIVKNSFYAVEKVDAELFGVYVPVNLSYNASGLTVQQSMLPDWSAFDLQSVNFVNYLQTNFPQITIDRRFTTTNLSLIYASHNQYYHYSYYTPGERVISIDVDPNVSKYHVEIYSPNANGTPSFPRVTTGNVNVSVIVKGTSGYKATASALVDPTTFLTDSVMSVGGLSGVVNISMSGYKIILHDFLGVPGNLTIRTTINVTTQPKMFLPSKVDVRVGNVQKSGMPRIF